MYDASDSESFAAAAKLHDSLEAALDGEGLDMPPCCVVASKVTDIFVVCGMFCDFF